MKILICADPEIPVPPKLYGGIERIIDALIKELRKRGHTVALAAHPGSSCPSDGFYPWPGTSSLKMTASVRNARALMKAVSHFRPDVIHSFSRLLYLAPLFAHPTPKIMSYQRMPTARTVRAAARLIKNIRFTGCSDYISALGRASGGDWTAVHNFVDTQFYRFAPSVGADAPLVFLSRIERIKGAHTAIEIAVRCRRRLILAGNRDPSPQGERYWQECIAPHIGKDGIEYAGPVDDDAKNALLGQAAGLLVPIEWNEPFGIVFAEALACGTPVISRPRGALPEIVRNGVEGFLCETVDDACDAVRRLPSIERSACRNRAETAFDVRPCADRYEKLYSGRSS